MIRLLHLNSDLLGIFISQNMNDLPAFEKHAFLLTINKLMMLLSGRVLALNKHDKLRAKNENWRDVILWKF